MSYQSHAGLGSKMIGTNFLGALCKGGLRRPPILQVLRSWPGHTTTQGCCRKYVGITPSSHQLLLWVAQW